MPFPLTRPPASARADDLRVEVVYNKTMQPSFRVTFIEPFIYAYTRLELRKPVEYYIMLETDLGSSAALRSIFEMVRQYKIPETLKPPTLPHELDIERRWDFFCYTTCGHIQTHVTDYAETGDIFGGDDDSDLETACDFYKFELLPIPKRLSFD
eukprot:6205042-Pleurochrysis_carterae.AAC.1